MRGSLRIQVVYAHVRGEQRIPRAWETVQRLAWEADQTFDSSARRQGGSLRVRYAVTKSCRVSVQDVALRKDQLANAYQEINAEMNRRLAAAQAAGKPKLTANLGGKRMIILDSVNYPGNCVGGGGDPQGGGSGLVSQTCGFGNPGLTHEMGHAFGLSHCGQSGGDGPNGSDPMCRNWGSKCRGFASTVLYDYCRTDGFSYLDFRPAPGSDLAENPLRNWVKSPYLIKKRPTRMLRMRLASTTAKGKCVRATKRGHLTLATCSRKPRQVWRRRPLPSGFFGLRNEATGKCVKRIGNAVRTARCDRRDPAQQWWFDAMFDHGEVHEMGTPESLMWNLDGSAVVLGGGSATSKFKTVY